MTTSPRKSAFKISSISTKTQKMKFIGWGKVRNKSCGYSSSYCCNFFFFFYEIWKMNRVIALMLTNFADNVNKKACLVLPSLFLRFHKNRKNINLNHSRQLLFHTFPPPMNFTFWVLVLKLKRWIPGWRSHWIYFLFCLSCVSKGSITTKTR